MNRWSIGVLAAILIVAAGCAPKADAPEDVAAIKALMAEWGQSASSGDASALAGYYTDNAVRMNMNVPILVGKEAIRSDWQSTLDRYTHVETDVAEDVQVVGDLAVARGTYTGKSTPKLPGGAVLNEKGKQVYVYRRQPGGAWKMIMDIWSSDLPVVQTLSPGSADEQALLQIERDWMAAWLKQDAAALDAIMADGFVENYQGQATAKKQFIADMKAGIYKVESTEVSDMRAVVFGDQAVVNGISMTKSTMRGKDTSGKSRWTDVYEKRDGRWRAVTTYLVKIE